METQEPSLCSIETQGRKDSGKTGHQERPWERDLRSPGRMLGTEKEQGVGRVWPELTGRCGHWPRQQRGKPTRQESAKITLLLSDAQGSLIALLM